jgi:spermidine/putrescine transport system substrate-binding protein
MDGSSGDGRDLTANRGTADEVIEVKKDTSLGAHQREEILLESAPQPDGAAPDDVSEEGARMDDATDEPSGISRRHFLKSSAFTSVGILLAACGRGGGGGGSGSGLTLRWLGWEHYNVPSLTEAFEEEFGASVSAGFFDGNSEAWNKLRAGGTEDFDLVMADGFWPRLYAEQGLTQPMDYGQISNMEHVFDDFLPPNFELLQSEDGGEDIAAPNCWGGYGMTVNMDRVDEADHDSLYLLFDEKYKDHLSTSARFEENIALAGILAARELGTIDGERPDGNPFNPYVLTDEELERAKELLIKQKGLLVTRWNDEDTLEQLLRGEVVWASPEWSGIYRRIHFEKLEGETDLNMTHVLNPREGGLGWVDTWCITSGVQDDEKLELVHNWIDFRLRPENMVTVATDIGWAPTVDVRDRLEERYVETLFLNETSAIRDLYQFDAPSSPEKWQQVWSEVEAA